MSATVRSVTQTPPQALGGQVALQAQGLPTGHSAISTLEHRLHQKANDKTGFFSKIVEGFRWTFWKIISLLACICCLSQKQKEAIADKLKTKSETKLSSSTSSSTSSTTTSTTTIKRSTTAEPKSPTTSSSSSSSSTTQTSSKVMKEKSQSLESKPKEAPIVPVLGDTQHVSFGGRVKSNETVHTTGHSVTVPKAKTSMATIQQPLKTQVQSSNTMLLSRRETRNGYDQNVSIKIDSVDRSIEDKVRQCLDQAFPRGVMGTPVAPERIRICGDFILTFKKFDEREDALAQLTRGLLQQASDGFRSALNQYELDQNIDSLKKVLDAYLNTILGCAAISESSVGSRALEQPDIDWGGKTDWRDINKTKIPANQVVCKDAKKFLERSQREFWGKDFAKTKDLDAMDELLTYKVSRLSSTAAKDIVTKF